MERHIYKGRVQYREVDKMGFMHNANYYCIFEIGRIELARDVGIPYKKVEDEGIIYPVAESKAKYLIPLTYDEEYTVETWISKFKTFSLRFDYEIKNIEGKVCCKGYTVHTSITMDTKEFVEMPEDWRRRFNTFYITEDAK